MISSSNHPGSLEQEEFTHNNVLDPSSMWTSSFSHTHTCFMIRKKKMHRYFILVSCSAML